MVKLKNVPFRLKWGKKIQARKAILPSAPVYMIGMMIVSGYLFKKIPEKPVSIRAFEPPWGKRKAPVFVSKAGTYYGTTD